MHALLPSFPLHSWGAHVSLIILASLLRWLHVACSWCSRGFQLMGMLPRCLRLLLMTLNAWRSFACMGLNVRMVVGGAGGLLIGFFGAVLHCLCMLCMMCKAPHWLVSFPFFSDCLWFLSTWWVPLGSLALQSLWLQSVLVCFCCFRLLVLLLGELVSLRVQEVIECFWQRLLVG